MLREASRRVLQRAAALSASGRVGGALDLAAGRGRAGAGAATTTTGAAAAAARPARPARPFSSSSSSSSSSFDRDDPLPIASWATIDPDDWTGANPAVAANLVGGRWHPAGGGGAAGGAVLDVVDPLDGAPLARLPDTPSAGPAHRAFVDSLRACPKHGLHNPLKDPQRYVMWGAVTSRAAAEMRRPAVADFFARLVQRTSPKSRAQALAEVTVTRRFLENFSGDQVRFLARGFSNPGDHPGQQSTGLRWPFGPVAIVTPFNFPLEIPALQAMGALYMGNKPLVHVDHRVSVVIEQFLRLLHACGAPPEDCDLLHGRGEAAHAVLLAARPRSTLFTGSQRVADRLALDLRGKVFLEDAGFDWKVLGPDVRSVEHVAWQCDQDAYACSGQKCSATSMLFVHENWLRAGLLEKLRARAARRRLEDLTVGPVLSWTTEAMLAHVQDLLEKVPGSDVLWGGRPLLGGRHAIPARYGAIEPTAVRLPLRAMLSSDAAFAAATTEVFGPVQAVVPYADAELPLVLESLERMSHHLTAAVVSNDAQFLQTVLARSVNGTTYAGARARTTGAPQNHWFGPAGDPRGAGIGTPEAIRLVWSCHREIIYDMGPAQEDAEAAELPVT
jgi:1-pyrroline-5-carboxylate dehydrogenase